MRASYAIKINADRGKYLEQTGRQLDVPIIYTDGTAYLGYGALQRLSALHDDEDGFIEGTETGLWLWVGGDSYPVERLPVR